MRHREQHRTQRIGWLRAAVLGANDGIVSTASLIVGVASAASSRHQVIVAGMAGVVAGALSMAAGEYVSVSSQGDTEEADLHRESSALEKMPDIELKELAGIYQKRGVDETLSLQVAAELMRHNALEAHAKDELGINEITHAKPLQAAAASFSSFLAGATLPLIVSLLAPLKYMIPAQYVFSIFFLVLLGAVSAKAGGSGIAVAVARISFWGTVAMAVTAAVGYLFGVAAA